MNPPARWMWKRTTPLRWACWWPRTRSTIRGLGTAGQWIPPAPPPSMPNWTAKGCTWPVTAWQMPSMPPRMQILSRPARALSMSSRMRPARPVWPSSIKTMATPMIPKSRARTRRKKPPIPLRWAVVRHPLPRQRKARPLPSPQKRRIPSRTGRSWQAASRWKTRTFPPQPSRWAKKMLL